MMSSLTITNLLVVCYFFTITHIRAQQSSCITPNGESARCVSIYSCPILYDVVTTTNANQLRFLRESQCGRNRRKQPLVCCGPYDNYRSSAEALGDEPNWGSSNRRTSSDSGFNSNTRDERPSWGSSSRRTTSGFSDRDENTNEWGSGKRTSSGSGERRTGSGYDSGERRTSSGSNDRRTSSGSSDRRTGYGSSERRTEDTFGGDRIGDRRTNQNSRGLPDRSACGIQEVDRILNGQVTDLREFPWMALLQYRKKSGNLAFSCGGSLISSRYVLTAAHCVRGQILTKIGPLVNVRLGEYNTETDRDCSNQLGFEICNDKPVDSGIDKITAHPGYNENSADRHNDIALIRLKREVPVSDFIKPICLPSRAEKSSVGNKLVVAGWGRTEYSSSSPVKLKLWVPVVASSQCAARFRSAGVDLGNKQLCAGGERGKDSCSGDSGGPLMATTKNDSAQWYIEGIVSFGAKCGSEGWPGIYTRVGEYIDWIRNNID